MIKDVIVITYKDRPMIVSEVKTLRTVEQFINISNEAEKRLRQIEYFKNKK